MRLKCADNLALAKLVTSILVGMSLKLLYSNTEGIVLFL